MESIKNKIDKLHQLLCDRYDLAKTKKILAHKNNDQNKKQRYAGQMDAFESVIIHVQNLRREL